MENLSVFNPNLATLGRERLGMSSFGLLSQLFVQEVTSRATARVSFFQPLALELLEDGDEEPPQPSQLNVKLDLTVILNKLRRELQKDSGKKEQTKTPPAPEQRILERVVLREIYDRYARTHQLSVQFPQLRRELSAAVTQVLERHTLPGTSSSLLSEGTGGGELARQIAEQAARLLRDQAEKGGKGPGRPVLHTLPVHRGISPLSLSRGGRMFPSVSGEGKRSSTVSSLAAMGQPIARSSSVLTTQMMTAPAAGGWTPQWRQSHPGFPSGKEMGQSEGAGSILTPDILKMRRDAALALRQEGGGAQAGGETPPSLAWALPELSQRQQSGENGTLAHALRDMVTRTLAENRAQSQGRSDGGPMDTAPTPRPPKARGTAFSTPTVSQARAVAGEKRGETSPGSEEKKPADAGTGREYNGNAVFDGKKKREGTEAESIFGLPAGGETAKESDELIYPLESAEIISRPAASERHHAAPFQEGDLRSAQPPPDYRVQPQKEEGFPVSGSLSLEPASTSAERRSDGSFSVLPRPFSLTYIQYAGVELPSSGEKIPRPSGSSAWEDRFLAAGQLPGQTAPRTGQAGQTSNDGRLLPSHPSQRAERSAHGWAASLSAPLEQAGRAGSSIRSPSKGEPARPGKALPYPAENRPGDISPRSGETMERLVQRAQAAPPDRPAVHPPVLQADLVLQGDVTAETLIPTVPGELLTGHLTESGREDRDAPDVSEGQASTRSMGFPSETEIAPSAVGLAYREEGAADLPPVSPGGRWPRAPFSGSEAVSVAAVSPRTPGGETRNAGTETEEFRIQDMGNLAGEPPSNVPNTMGEILPLLGIPALDGAPERGKGLVYSATRSEGAPPLAANLAAKGAHPIRARTGQVPKGSRPGQGGRAAAGTFPSQERTPQSRERQIRTVLRDVRLGKPAAQVTPPRDLKREHGTGSGPPPFAAGMSVGTEEENTPWANRQELTFLAQPEENRPERNEPPQRGSFKGESDYIKSLPGWAQELLQKPDTPQSLAGGRGAAGRAPFPAGAGAAVSPSPPGQITWTAPGAPQIPGATAASFSTRRQDVASRPAEIKWVERAGESQSQPVAKLSEGELRRTADRIYRMIEERLRVELRRSGR